jgi:hypothetical protein
VQRRERAELLGDDERRVVREHHAAGADADGARAGGHVGDHHRRRRARHAGHVVVLGEPVAAEAEPLGVAREVERVAERLGGVAAGADGGEVEDGERDHAARYPGPPPATRRRRRSGGALSRSA